MHDLYNVPYRIDYKYVIKVADFGLSETIETSKQYFRQDKEVVVRLPIKWLAPESINEGVFSEKSDVVSHYAVGPYEKESPPEFGSLLGAM